MPSVQWFAGFFDGEGSVFIVHPMVNGRRSYRMVVSITNVDRRVLEVFQESFGGTITTVDGSAYKNTSKVWYMWRVSSRIAGRFLMVIAPYLVLPKNVERVKLALEFQEQKVPTGGHNDEYSARQERLYTQFKEACAKHI